MSCLDTESWFIVFSDERIDDWDQQHIKGSEYAHEIGLWRGADCTKPRPERYIYAYTVESSPPRLILLSAPEYYEDAKTEVNAKQATTTYMRLDADGTARIVITKNLSEETLSVLFHPEIGNIALIFRLPVPTYEETKKIAAAAELTEEVKPKISREEVGKAAAAPREGDGDWGSVPVVDPFVARPAIALGGLIRYAIFPSVRVGEPRKTDTTRGAVAFTAPWNADTETITVYDEGAYAFEIWPNASPSPARLPITYVRAPHVKGHLCIPVPDGDADPYGHTAKTMKRAGHENVFTKEFVIADNGVVYGARVVCAEDTRGRRLFMWITGSTETGQLADAGTIMLSANAQYNTDMNTR